MGSIAVQQLKKKGTYIDFKPKTGNKTLDIEIMVLCLKMETHQDYLLMNSLKPFKNPMELIIGNLSDGPFFSLKIKKTFDFSVRESMSITDINTPEDVEV